MKKLLIFSLSLCFATTAAFAALELTEQWKKTDYACHAREMSLSGGKLYVIDKNTNKLQIINPADGAGLTAPSIAHTNIVGYAVAADNAGYLIVTTGVFGIANLINECKVVDDTYVGSTTTTAAPGRFDPSLGVFFHKNTLFFAFFTN